MKIYLFMRLNDVIGNEYYTDEEEVKKLVDEANAKYGGDFGYMALEPNTVKEFPCEDCVGGKNVVSWLDEDREIQGEEEICETCKGTELVKRKGD